MKKLTLKQAKEMYEFTVDTLERQSTASPTIEFYKDHVFFNSCSVMYGSHMVVKEGLTKTVISSDALREILVEFNKKDAIRYIWKICNEFLDSKKEGKEELFKGLEEARLDFNGWSGQCRIMIDFEDMSAWFEIESKQYHDYGKTIFNLIMKGDFYNPNERYSAERLNEIAQEKIKLFEKGYITKLMAD